MDSDQEYLYESDSGNESSENDVGLEFDSESEGGSANAGGKFRDLDEYPYEVYNIEDLMKHMIECIKDVNNVVNVSISN